MSRARPVVVVQEEQKENEKEKEAKSTVDETAGAAGTTGGLPALREFHRARRRLAVAALRKLNRGAFVFSWSGEAGA